METVVALVLLGGCVLLISALIQRTNYYQRRSESLLEAASFADRVLDEVRDWAQDGTNYDGNWNYWRGRIVTDPAYPGMSARVDVQNTGLTLYSPDERTEVVLEPSDPRILNRAYVSVRVQAGRDLNSSAGRMEVWTMIGAPAPDVSGARVEIDGSFSEVAVGESRGFTAKAFDGTGRELPQACFEWELHGRGGSASYNTVGRDGRRFSLRHDRTESVEDPSNPDNDIEVPAGGDVEIVAQCRLMGRLIRGTRVVPLADPGIP